MLVNWVNEVSVTEACKVGLSFMLQQTHKNFIFFGPSKFDNFLNNHVVSISYLRYTFQSDKYSSENFLINEFLN